MVPITGGEYLRPLEKGAKPRTVAPFLLDVRQVTNGEFLAFVIAHPQWQRSNINRLFAERSYLSHWAADTVLGPAAPPDSPVVCVSWHAAKAFLKAAGKRLPSVDEWEFAARADESKPDASADPAFRQKILDWYSKPTLPVLPSVSPQRPNFFGVSGLHGLVWEWTGDFVSAMSSGEGRSDGSPDTQLFCGGGGADPNQAIEYAAFMRISLRASLQGDFCLPGLGFRGARDMPAQRPVHPSAKQP
jgi:formylglycine-generating enzyme required for sulfatase activity